MMSRCQVCIISESQIHRRPLYTRSYMKKCLQEEVAPRKDEGQSTETMNTWTNSSSFRESGSSSYPILMQQHLRPRNWVTLTSTLSSTQSSLLSFCHLHTAKEQDTSQDLSATILIDSDNRKGRRFCAVNVFWSYKQYSLILLSQICVWAGHFICKLLAQSRT